MVAAMKKKATVVAIKTVTSRPVLALWASVSLCVAALCCWSYPQPAWTIRSRQISSWSAVSETPLGRRLQRSIVDQQPDTFPLSNATDAVDAVDAVEAAPGRNTIPLVYIGLFGMCIYTNRELRHVPATAAASPASVATCVTHAELDYEWLPPAWQVINSLGSNR